MATEMFAETMENLQHLTWHVPKSQNSETVQGSVMKIVHTPRTDSYYQNVHLQKNEA
jgi:hypothetical protein